MFPITDHVWFRDRGAGLGENLTLNLILLVSLRCKAMDAVTLACAAPSCRALKSPKPYGKRHKAMKPSVVAGLTRKSETLANALQQMTTKARHVWLSHGGQIPAQDQNFDLEVATVLVLACGPFAPSGTLCLAYAFMR